jgi:cell division initiation protein
MGTMDIQHKRFRTRWMGLDPSEVEIFCRQLTEEIQHLKAEGAKLRRDLQDQEKELREYKDREKTIRNVLLNAHKTVEQMKSNAEKEAGLIVAEAELKAEKVLQGAHQRLAQLHEDITELKRHRIQLETKLRSTIATYQQLLDLEKEDEKESELENKVKFLSR